MLSYSVRKNLGGFNMINDQSNKDGINNRNVRDKANYPWEKLQIMDEVKNVTEEEITLCEMAMKPFDQKTENLELEEASIEIKKIQVVRERYVQHRYSIYEKVKTILEERPLNLESILHHLNHNLIEIEYKLSWLQSTLMILTSDIVGWRCGNNYSLRQGWKVVSPKQISPEEYAENLKEVIQDMTGMIVEVIDMGTINLGEDYPHDADEEPVWDDVIYDNKENNN